MSKSWSMRSVAVVALAVAGMCLLGNPDEADARPQYLVNFAKSYPKLLSQAKKVKCMICHPKKDDKKTHNQYGEVLEHIIDGENVKDAEKIKKALKKAEKEDSAVDGKTYGELIKDGKLPNTGDETGQGDDDGDGDGDGDDE